MKWIFSFNNFTCQFRSPLSIYFFKSANWHTHSIAILARKHYISHSLNLPPYFELSEMSKIKLHWSLRFSILQLASCHEAPVWRRLLFQSQRNLIIYFSVILLSPTWRGYHVKPFIRTMKNLSVFISSCFMTATFLNFQYHLVWFLDLFYFLSNQTCRYADSDCTILSWGIFYIVFSTLWPKLVTFQLSCVSQTTVLCQAGFHTSSTSQFGSKSPAYSSHSTFSFSLQNKKLVIQPTLWLHVVATCPLGQKRGRFLEYVWLFFAPVQQNTGCWHQIPKNYHLTSHQLPTGGSLQHLTNLLSARVQIL